MTRAGSILQWRTGKGWLVLAGGGDFRTGETEILDARALALADADRPVAYVPAASTRPHRDGPGFVEYVEELGGPGGYVVPLYSPEQADDADVESLLAEAGLIVLGGGERELDLARAFRSGKALTGLARAFENGAVIYGLEEGAMPLGWAVARRDDAADPIPALGWVGSAFVEPHFSSLQESPRALRLLERFPECFCLGIPDRVALALGPNGEVETWGAGQVTVSLGAGWRRE